MQLNFDITATDGQPGLSSGLGDLLVVANDGRLLLASIGGAGDDRVALRDPAADLALVDATGTSGGSAVSARVGLAVVSVQGGDRLVALPASGGATAYALGGPADAVLDHPSPLIPETAGGIAALRVVPVAGGDLLIAAPSSTGGGLTPLGLTCWVRAPDGSLAARPPLQVSQPGDTADISDIEVLSRDGSTWVFAASAGSGRLDAWQLDGAGAPISTLTLGAEQGLAVGAPDKLDVVTLAGRDFVLVAAPGSSTISVAELTGGEAPALVMRDQVGDDLSTRFHRVSVLETVTVEGRVFIIAGGADDGLSLMTLLPGGRLLHLDTLAHDTGMALANPTALAATWRDGRIEIFAAGEGVPGISRIVASPGALAPILAATASGGELVGDDRDDLLSGGAGDDTLHGGAGDDILRDGAGADRLFGGAGADVFVLDRDGRIDMIEDFEPGVDRIDASTLARVYSLSEAQVTVEGGALRLTLGAETTLIRGAGGQALDPFDLTDATVFDLWHHDLTFVPEPPLTLIGSAGPDLLSGGTGPDTIHAGAGADTIFGGSGDDLLCGEAGATAFDDAAAQVYRLYQAALGREPGAQGLRYWTDVLLAGTPSEDVAAGFLASAEFRARFSAETTAEFVTLVYRNVLGRDPEPTGLAYWVDAIDEGGLARTDVMLAITNSAENRDRTQPAALAFSYDVTRAGWADEVYRLYDAVLARDPEAGGLRYWTGVLADGETLGVVSEGFVASPEFRTRFDVAETDEFVTLLYQNVLGRVPDPDGLAYWSGAIDSGEMSRADAVLRFSESPENRARTAPLLRDFLQGSGIEGDRLDGGGGDDLLVGGLGADTFVFRAADHGYDEVIDLEPWDRIELSGFAIASAADAQAALTQADSGAFLDLGEVEILFRGVAPNDIGADQFVLV